VKLLELGASVTSEVMIVVRHRRVSGREPAKGCTAASSAGAWANRLPVADRFRLIAAGEAVHATLDRLHATHHRQEPI
jgi:hypothetical protein